MKKKLEDKVTNLSERLNSLELENQKLRTEKWNMEENQNRSRQQVRYHFVSSN